MPLDWGAIVTHINVASFSVPSSSSKQTLFRCMPKAGNTAFATAGWHTSGTFFTKCLISFGSFAGISGGCSPPIFSTSAISLLHFCRAIANALFTSVGIPLFCDRWQADCIVLHHFCSLSP